MKIELKKETKLTVDGKSTNYWIEIDGHYINGSVCYDLIQAEAYYETIKASNGKPLTKETLKSEEI